MRIHLTVVIHVLSSTPGANTRESHTRTIEAENLRRGSILLPARGRGGNGVLMPQLHLEEEERVDGGGEAHLAAVVETVAGDGDAQEEVDALADLSGKEVETELGRFFCLLEILDGHHRGGNGGGEIALGGRVRVVSLVLIHGGRYWY